VYEAAKYPIWIVSDLRRTEELQFFKELYKEKVTTIRIEANERIRMSRGFEFTPGVDDKPTECALDDFNVWDYRLHNDGAVEALTLLKPVLDLVL